MRRRHRLDSPNRVLSDISGCKVDRECRRIEILLRLSRPGIEIRLATQNESVTACL